MFKSVKGILFVLGTSALCACTSTQTTDSGVVGVNRSQWMSTTLSSEEINSEYAQSYTQEVDKARTQGTLETNTKIYAQVQRVSKRLIPQTRYFRSDAVNWDWQVNVIHSDELNANCGPGGKIMVYSGIVDQLKLSDDELAAVLGHEISHALREHGREQMSKAAGAGVLGKIAQAAGVDSSSIDIANMGYQYFMQLPNSREAEKEADLMGVELMARAGYNPEAAISLWKKMQAAQQGGPIEFMSTHPSDENRIASIQEVLPKVMPLYESAKQ